MKSNSKGGKKAAKVMREFSRGDLHSGSKDGPAVNQAVASQGHRNERSAQGRAQGKEQMSNTLPPEPKPMPTTGMPDRNDPPPRSDMEMKRGVSGPGLQVTNGRKPGK